MKTYHHPISLTVVAAILLLVLALPQLGFAQGQSMPDQPMPGMSAPATTNSPKDQQTTPQQGGLTLAELEQMALGNNPTLAQAAAEIRAVTARKLQSEIGRAHV